jgi:lantibiotic leader peptide-processing serine protease
MISVRTIVSALCVGFSVLACVEDSAVAPRPSTPAISAAASGPVSTASPAPSASASGDGRYLIVFKQGRSAAAAIASELTADGGRLEGLREDLGFAVVSGISADAAGRLRQAASVSSVDPDVEFGIEQVQADALDAGTIGTESATAPQTALLFGRQWNMRAIAADAAWAGGFLGSSNVSVAILDTGIDYLWPDLVGRVDTSRSISLRPDEDARLQTWFGSLNRHPITDLNAHGTLVASIVASNSGFFAGVTTRTTLFGVKVCTVFGRCSTSAIFNGIVYAVDHGADVINMSLGGGFPKNLLPGFSSVINRVFNYAKSHGTLIVVAAGNDAMDMDHNGNFYNTYCNSPHVICVSATGPTAAATSSGPFINPDSIAPYTNFGRSAIDLAAPGGGINTVNALVTGPCSQTALAWHQPPPPSPGAPLPPPVIDGPLCPRNLGLFLVRAAGTSFAAPHVTGVAASVVAVNGSGNPAQLRAQLIGSADDLGSPGTDPFYGKGRVNAARAVGAIP